MPSPLANSFIATRPRELSGSRSSNRFDYQKNWALCHLLALHEANKNYLIVLDYHEDVVVFDSEDSPQTAEFFQIKSKKAGNWTINALTKNNEDSILKKLYKNYELFRDHTKGMYFVSNQGLSENLYDNTQALELEKVNFYQLSVDSKKSIHECVEEEGASQCDINGLYLISFIRTKLPVQDNDTYAKGKLVEFFDKYLHNRALISISLAYKTIFDEIRRCSNSEGVCASMDDLCAKKGIGKTRFSEMIDVIVKHADHPHLWQETHNLLSNNFSLKEIRTLKTEWHKYVVDRMDASNEPIQLLRRNIVSAIGEFEKDHNNYEIRTLLDSLSQPIFDSTLIPLDTTYISAAIIYEVQVYDPIQKIDPEPEGEKA